MVLLDDAVNIAQVGLTVTFTAFAILLISSWWPGFKKAREMGRLKWRPEQWLVVGIVIGFAGGLVDQFYWGLHWLAVLYEHPAQPWLLSNGPLSNLFARQIPGIASVYCHLRAAHGLASEIEVLTTRSLIYLFLGIATCVLLAWNIFV